MEILKFDGYFDKNQTGNIPKRSGIYAAFACEVEGGNVLDTKLLYIGKGEGEEGIRGRIEAHIAGRGNEPVNGRQSTWEREYEPTGRVIKYAYARLNKNLHDVEAALIYHNKPQYNDLLKGCYCGNVNNMLILCTGDIGDLKSVTTICKRRIRNIVMR